MRALALEIANPIKDYVVWKDACKEGINGILTQEGHVIGHEPKKIKGNEKSYATCDLELAAIVHALKM